MQVRDFKWNKFVAVALVVAAAASVQAQAIDFDVAKGSLTIPEIKIGTTSLYNVVLRFDADGRFTPTFYSPTPPAAPGVTLTTFNGIRMDSLTFTQDTDGNCEDATLLITNTNSTPKTALLYFDVLVNGVVFRQLGFGASGLSSNGIAQSKDLVYGSNISDTRPCSAFTFQFNPANSVVI